MWLWIPLRRAVLDTTLCDKVCQWLGVGLWFSSKIKLTTLYIWHIVESDVKHHKPPSSKNLVKLFASSKGYQLLIFFFQIGICGHGVQSRNLSCVTEDGIALEPSKCPPDLNILIMHVRFIEETSIWNTVHGKVYSIQHYVIKFVNDLQQVGGFLQFPPPIKLTATI